MSKLDVSREAGAICYLLENKRILSVNEIIKLTNYQEQKVLFALGWLARDNRIVIINHAESNWTVRLNSFPMTEIHY